MKKQTLFADLNLLLVAFVWGATFVMVQNAIDDLEPFSFNAVRFTLAALLLWIGVFSSKDRLIPLQSGMVVKGFWLGSVLFAGYALQTIGLVYTTSSKAGFLTGLSLVFVPVLTYFILKQSISIFAMIGIALATLGLYFLAAMDAEPLNGGDVLVLICALGFAAHIVLTTLFAPHYSPIKLTAIQITFVALFNWVGAFISEPWQAMFDLHVLLKFDVLIALLVTAIFATAFAFFIQTTFQRHTSPTKVAIIFAMEPVFAGLTAYLWADEHLTGMAVIGCVLIVGGMIFAEVPKTAFYRLGQLIRGKL